MYALGELLPVRSSGTRQELHPCVALLETSLFQKVPEEQTRISSLSALYRVCNKAGREPVGGNAGAGQSPTGTLAISLQGGIHDVS